MTWKYSQSTGRLTRDGGDLVGQGYSGNGIGKNDPHMQSARNVGPIPVGNWSIEAPFRHSHAGNYTMRLVPSPMTNTYGRTGFMMHGDSAAHPGRASDGCIIMPFPTRKQVWESGDHRLQVVP